ncbi:MAG: peptidylprolyl isomerase [Enterococcus sp.]
MKAHKLILGISLVAALGIAGCANTSEDTDTSTSSSTSSSASVPSSSSSSVDLNALELPQLDTTVAENEDSVELVTSLGSIKIKLFPDIAPKAVENFMTHAKEGYYDGLTFHRVINDFMIQGGDPDGDGTGGESIWGEGFAVEPSNQLYNIRGALSMARSTDPNSNGSQFFIVQNKDDQSSSLSEDVYPEKIIDAYKDGGYPSLDGQYTVFGQVIDGMDVVDKIAAVDTDSSDKPTEDVTIDKINILQEAK